MVTRVRHYHHRLLNAWATLSALNGNGRKPSVEGAEGPHGENSESWHWQSITSRASRASAAVVSLSRHTRAGRHRHSPVRPFPMINRDD